MIDRQHPSLRDFTEQLDLRGATLERWPADARGAAEALLAVSPEARVLLGAMAEVEAALAMPLAGSDDRAAARFAAVATRHRQDRRPFPTGARRAGWGAAVAAALALGLVVGDAGRGVLHEDYPVSVLASALDPATGAADVD